MKKYNFILPAVFISLFSLSSFAAENVTYVNESFTPIKTISVRGAKDYQDVVEKLSLLADRAGATKYKIILLNSNENSEGATAMSYK